MFSNPMKEALAKEVPLGLVTGHVLKLLISFCYTGSIEIRADTAEELLATAGLLQLYEVVSACCAYFRSQINSSNCLGIALYAEQQNCYALMREALEFTLRYFGQVTRHLEFLQLNADQLTKLLANDNLRIRSESDVFAAVVTWLRHDKKARERDIPGLLKHIRLPLLTLKVSNHRSYLLNTNYCL